jgi:hypothetical protein
MNLGEIDGGKSCWSVNLSRTATFGKCTPLILQENIWDLWLLAVEKCPHGADMGLEWLRSQK